MHSRHIIPQTHVTLLAAVPLSIICVLSARLMLFTLPTNWFTQPKSTSSSARNVVK